MAEVEVPLTDGVNVPLIETVALGVEDAESVDDGLIELVAVSEFVVLWERVPDPEILDVCDGVSVVDEVAVGKLVTDGDVDAVCAVDADADAVFEGVTEIDLVSRLLMLALLEMVPRYADGDDVAPVVNELALGVNEALLLILIGALAVYTSTVKPSRLHSEGNKHGVLTAATPTPP